MTRDAVIREDVVFKAAGTEIVKINKIQLDSFPL